MAYLNDRVLDLGLNVLTTEADALHICSAARPPMPRPPTRCRRA